MKTGKYWTLFGKGNIDHTLRRNGILHDITEGRVRVKPTREKRIQMLRVLANDGYIALKQTAEDTEGWKHREMMSKTCSLAEDYW